MTLTPGTKLGPYEVLSAIGAGGMGEVYRAHDSRLGRDVAVKILPETFSADKERVSRFEQEARAVATLNHPNIVAVYDIGEYAGSRYIVSELLDGEALRAKLADGALPIRKVQEYATQIAQGLAAAHDKGIVHRDLKPENIIITKESRAKILDFGLAKQSMPALATGATLTGVPQTSPGMTLGTIGYMSPEQVRGQTADHRSDIFCFGAVLHEMLSGERPFKRDTSAEVMTAILKDDPPELTSSAIRPIPPAIDRIMRRCLEKDPEQRFQSARDLAFALEAMSGVGSASTQAGIGGKVQKVSIPLPAALIATGVLAALLAAGSYAYIKNSHPAQPIFRQLTASRGTIRMARFSPDGQSVVFGGMWNGEPMKLYSQRTDASVFNPLAVPDADILSVASTGDLAISLGRKYTGPHSLAGTLARTSFTGGAPREVLESVLDADWSPDGSQLAVSRRVGGRFRLEYPVGKILFENDGYISHIRFNHKGDKIAFMEHQVFGDDRGYVSVVDLNGKYERLTADYPSEDGLAWTPDDQEIWFSANEEFSGMLYSLHAVTLDKKDRVVLHAPVTVRIQDIAKDGSVLLVSENYRIDVTMGDTATGATRDLTWVDNAWQQRLSEDAKWMILSTQEPGGTTNYSVFLRKTDGSPAVKIGEGDSLGISPDDKWVISNLLAAHSIGVLPMGAGEPRTIHSDSIFFDSQTALFMPDGKKFLVSGHENAKPSRTYLLSVDGGEPKAVTPEGVVAQVLSPDGKTMVTQDAHGQFAFTPLDGGASRPAPGIGADDFPTEWLKDGRTLVVRTADLLTVNTYELDIQTGNKKPWKSFPPKDKVGMQGVYNFQLTADGAHYILAEQHAFSYLFVVSGLK